MKENMSVDGSIVKKLQSILSNDAIFADSESLERYSFDALNPHRLHSRPHLAESRVLAVVQPANSLEVRQLVQLANEFDFSLIPYGGGTGVMGSVIPFRKGIAVDMKKMDSILEINAQERLAVAQPGVILAQLAAEAAQYNLVFGHDPWSLPIATLGGAISTNGIGYRASKYGSMGDQVRGLEIVLGNGDIVRTRSLFRPSGPHPNGLFVGAEGTMGIITEATIQLFGQPESREFMTLGFSSFEAGFPTVLKLFDLGLIPALIDFTEEEPREDARGFRAILYLGFEGYSEEVSVQQQRTLAEAVKLGGTNLGPEITEAYWNQRHEPGQNWKEQVQPLRPSQRWKRSSGGWVDYLHLSLPVSAVLEYHQSAKAIARQKGLMVREAAIWTDPRLYSIMLTDPTPNHAGRHEAASEAVDYLLEEALRLGGSIEYCHGIGAKLDPYAVREWGSGLSLARLIKEAVDPGKVLNPDKLAL